jgi:MFS transporter, FSR family, fosmidomycin resistance protein
MTQVEAAPSSMSTGAAAPRPAARAAGATYSVLFAMSFCHLLNDMMQALAPAMYPILKTSFALDFTQIGLITLTYQMTACLLQPAVGLYTDHKPKPFSLAFGMGFTLIGLVSLSVANSYALLLVSVAVIGLGSAIFHPEASRVARMASGGRFGLAQSIFQVGGNAGSAIGPLMAAVVILPGGQRSVAWFSAAALLAAAILYQVGRWYAARNAERSTRAARAVRDVGLPRSTVALAICVLVSLSFAKGFYVASITSYFQFYLIERFHVDVRTAQMMLFLFAASVAAGTLLGGPLGDRFGRRAVLWFSMLGALPFSLALPYAGLGLTMVLAMIVGVIIASTFSVIVVYAQELLPGKTGLVAGVFFGLSFGVSGVGAAALGRIADMTSVTTVYQICSYLPLIGVLVVFLPDLRSVEGRK